jgi:glutamine phosphoribosylpyrophosphate amidotransferase
MCGIIGYYSEKPSLNHARIIQKLAYGLKIRGLHAFGLSYYSKGKIITRKFLDFPLEEEFKESVKDGKVIWHNRYTTSGDWKNMDNNQPIHFNDISIAGNCVVSMKPKEEYEAEFKVSCITENDTEIVLRVIEQERDIEAFIKKIRGSFAGVYLNGGRVWTIRNIKRPLYYFDIDNASFVVSTKDTIKRAGINICPVPVKPFRLIEVGKWI